MYLASFETPGATVIQGCVRLPALPLLPAPVREQWWAAFARLVGNVRAVQGAEVALRVVLAANGFLERALFVAAPRERERELRRYLGSFTRLDTIVEGSAALP